MHLTYSNSSKRRFDDEEVTNKKTRPEILDEVKLKITTSNEWPVYAHPQGGSIKLTPWGTLRTYLKDDGEEVVKFEDTSFSEYSYIDDNNDTDTPRPPPTANLNDGGADSDTAMPSTPQSLYGNANNNNNNMLPLTMYSSTSANQAIIQNQYGTSGFRLSPSEEAELYVINGYNRMSTPPNGTGELGYSQEQEHYLGIVQHEEFDEREMEME
ncbi:uncharacterized protein KQ657_004158 [Scheffersomyces spartinae]|uniref:Uncharacterized protein n=1 Tax=Scheffersomyces spartinae TaxID=45513 RepID=A0A9P8AJM8_9ASCO|nr:uncharacterized protein KQ657_004158 [Scheffersomyces spartinae]KAG7195044.1 hypothetical protein KQ657_004158 [Scheffersomyces spartinae]